jgi:hypothetical protein
VNALVEQAAFDAGLFAGIVDHAGCDPLGAWHLLGDEHAFSAGDARAGLIAGILRTLPEPMLAQAAAFLLDGITLHGGGEEAETRRLLWALACAHAGADIVRGGR